MSMAIPGYAITMSAAFFADNQPPVDERFRRAALAAAMAVKSAGPAADIPSVVENTGIANTVSPLATATIAISISDLVREGGIQGLTSEPTINTIASAAAKADSPMELAVGHSAGTVLPPSAPPSSFVVGSTGSAANPAPQFDPARLYDLLSRQSNWIPIATVYEEAGNGDRAGFDAALGQLHADGFVAIENEHVYVTESGRRFLEYTRYSLK